MNKVALTLKNIFKKYQQGKSIVEVLSNVNLTVMQGELVGIIGSSGSGKSTLLHIAGLLDTPDSGEIQIASTNYSQNCTHIIRLHNIGFVYQQHHLLKDFTALENVAIPKLIAGNNHKSAFREAEELLVELGLANKIHNMPGELSGGEQQRVAIARSLINNPQIILADEPTGNLDPSTANKVFNLLLKTVNQKNISIIIVTHNHEMAHKMHRVYQLKHGELLFYS
ncbi:MULTISPECIES: ABC transporter ATP-binding protein [unclassified Candidatus Tisiphia]|uniref:ABC transporter ATP-binding protein n=1 Tax=unclassified Candidatus Tisiphia TaxID=2996318 RepID=UPI00312CA819